MENNFALLSDDVLTDVLRFLTPVELLHVERTCKLFRDLFGKKEIWKSVCRNVLQMNETNEASKKFCLFVDAGFRCRFCLRSVKRCFRCYEPVSRKELRSEYMFSHNDITRLWKKKPINGSQYTVVEVRKVVFHAHFGMLNLEMKQEIKRRKDKKIEEY